MGKLNDLRQLPGYRDDDAASTSSAVPLHDQPYADDVPPAYTDNLDSVDPQNHESNNVSARKSVGGEAPGRLFQNHDAQADPSPDDGLQEREKMLQDVQWTFSANQDAKGSTDTYISKTLSSDPVICQAFIERQAQVHIQPAVRLIGTHTETRRRDKKDETTRVTDFDITVPLDSLFTPAWARMKIVENHEKAYRGGIRKQLDLRVKAHPEAAATAPSLQEWCHRFCASSASAKSYVDNYPCSSFRCSYDCGVVIRLSDCLPPLSACSSSTRAWMLEYMANPMQV